MGMIIMNGKEYTSSPKDGFPPLIYSDEEREVGVWRDGKPLYQKTLIVPKNIGTGNNVQYAHNIPNIDRVIGFEYGGMLSNGGIYRITYDSTYRIWVHEINRTMVLWALGSSIIQYLDSLFVTMQYTKTTDVAGSGKYTTYGGIAHHYSESEQVIGTWIDGKPLYEKLYTFTSAIQINTDGTTVSGIVTTNMREIVSCKAIRTQNTSGSTKTPAVLYTEAVKSGDAIKLFHNPAFGGVDIVVIQYTKTTD